MIDLEPPHRRATLDDAPALAELVNFAGEGLPLYLWGKMAGPGETASEVGVARARRDEGAFSWRNAVVREEDDRAVAGLIGYPLPDASPASDYSELPPMFVPMQQLEDAAPGTWYVNVLASYPRYRGRGFGHDLLEVAVAMARASGRRGLSLIVSDANEGARRFYRREGFVERGRRPMVKEAWANPGTHWVLMVRPDPG